jgi:anti-sigma factor RsiW
MKDHSTWEQMLAHYRELDERRRRELDEHVAGCEACAAQLAAYRRMDEEIAGMMQHRKSLVLHSRRDEQMRADVYAAFETEGRGWNAGRLPALLGSLAGIAAMLLLTAGLVWTFRTWPDEMPEVALNSGPRLTATIAPTYTPPAPIVVVPSPSATMTPAPTVTVAPTQEPASTESGVPVEPTATVPPAPSVTPEPGGGGGSGEGEALPLQPLMPLEPLSAPDFSPDGACLVGHDTTPISTEDRGPYASMLRVVSIGTGESWLASERGTTVVRQHHWLSNGQLLWVDQGRLFVADCDGQNRRDLQAPEPIFSIAGVGVGDVAVVLSGQEGTAEERGTPVWRVDVPAGRWDLVPAPPEGTALPADTDAPGPYTVPALSEDGTSAYLMGPNYDTFLLRLPLTLGEPPVLVTNFGPLNYVGGEGPLLSPVPLVDSPYWFIPRPTWRDAAQSFMTNLLLDSRDGRLVPVQEVIGQELAGMAQVSPDGRWLALSVAGTTVTGPQSFSTYVAPSSDLSSGRTLYGSVVGWQSQPAAVFLLQQQLGGGRRFARAPLPEGDPVILLDSSSRMSPQPWYDHPTVSASSEAIFVSDQEQLHLFTGDGTTWVTMVNLTSTMVVTTTLEDGTILTIPTTLPILGAVGTNGYVVAGGPDEATRDEPYLWRWDVAALLPTTTPPITPVATTEPVTHTIAGRSLVVSPSFLLLRWDETTFYMVEVNANPDQPTEVLYEDGRPATVGAIQIGDELQIEVALVSSVLRARRIVISTAPAAAYEPPPGTSVTLTAELLSYATRFGSSAYSYIKPASGYDGYDSLLITPETTIRHADSRQAMFDNLRPTVVIEIEGVTEKGGIVRAREIVIVVNPYP